MKHTKLSDPSRGDADSDNLALSYARFSDPSQGDGDSEDRQARDFATFCHLHKLTPSKNIFIDRGLSGYHGRHVKSKGDLRRLIDLAKRGTFPKGTVIVVEAWDRLGRMRPDLQTDLVMELVRTGVGIGVCKLNDIFREADIGTHKWIVLQVFIQIAYQESEQKSRRLKEAWKTRKEKARKGELQPPRKKDGRVTMTLNSRGPAWLEEKDGKWAVIPERVKVVKRIFELARKGYGHKRIVQTLTEEGVPAFGEVKINKNCKRSQFSGKWCRAYISLILNDKRVLGELPLGDGGSIPGYYPAVIGGNEFKLAKEASDGRKRKNWRARQRTHINLFHGILSHAVDGEGFCVINQRTAKNPLLVLCNTKGVDGRATCVTFPYPVFEAGVLACMREVKPSDVFPVQGDDRVEELRKKFEAITGEVDSLADDVRRGYSRTLTQVLREKELEQERVKGELDSARAERAHPLADSWAFIVHNGIAETEEKRLQLRVELQRTVQRIDILIGAEGRVRVALVQVSFAGSDLRRHMVVCYRSPSRNGSGEKRAGCALAWSYKDIAGWVDKQRDLGQYRSDERVRAGYDRYIRELLPDVVAAMKGDDKAKRKLADSEGRQNVVSWTID
ncbi:MAG TPA: recombinase family protein [Gemmataceae bacterium]|jgi:DNA invertase Pin-like site-specific DNA recombinase